MQKINILLGICGAMLILASPGSAIEGISTDPDDLHYFFYP